MKTRINDHCTLIQSTGVRLKSVSVLTSTVFFRDRLRNRKGENERILK